jgi:uncharacterized damage-inducible protein DinB
MKSTWHADAIKEIEKFWNKSTSVFKEKDSGFSPTKGTYTVAQHVAHVAQAIDWFMEGAFRQKGFDTDFEAMNKEVQKTKSLKAAQKWMKTACARAYRILKEKTREDMQLPILGPLMMGEPRIAIITAMFDHTAHHRGALTVYARLLDRVSPMPYM